MPFCLSPYWLEVLFVAIAMLYPMNSCFFDIYSPFYYCSDTHPHFDLVLGLPRPETSGSEIYFLNQSHFHAPRFRLNKRHWEASLY